MFLTFISPVVHISSEPVSMYEPLFQPLTPRHIEKSSLQIQCKMFDVDGK